MRVRTASGTTIDLTGPGSYVRTPAGGVPRQHTCLIWGAALPADGIGDWNDGRLIIPTGPDSGAVARMIACVVALGAPLCFVTVDKDGAVRFRFSTPVVEVDGKTVTPEGVATELPEKLKKLLGGQESPPAD